jgi:hypothetical protein
MIHPLTKAFRELAKAGWLAKRRLACCRSCATAGLPDDLANLNAYTTSQSDDNIKENGEGYIYWSAPEDNPKEIIKALKAQGLEVKWNKDPKTAIFIKVKVC